MHVSWKCLQLDCDMIAFCLFAGAITSQRCVFITWLSHCVFILQQNVSWCMCLESVFNLMVICMHSVCLQVQSPIKGVSSTLGPQSNVINYFLCACRYNPSRRAGDKTPVSVFYNVSQCVFMNLMWMYVGCLKLVQGPSKAAGMVFLEYICTHTHT